jgi:tRNA-specific 2-thiouridylase
VRLLAAMSGGVDSSVAAALLVREGNDVTGVTLRQWDDPGEMTRRTKGCSVVDAVADARRVADTLGIPHYTLDFREVFSRAVIEPFVADYAAGRTPNPCVRCNEIVRFGALLDRAHALGFDGLITGHYARVLDGRLFRARDRSRDQSYVLHAVPSEALRRVHFPLGEFASKAAVRELASALGLQTWDREDSLDVCFVPEGARAGDLVGAHVPMAVRRGPIVDEHGTVLGEHRGLAYYTVGQRKGLGALGARRYVAAIDACRNAVVVGGPPAAMTLVAERPRFVRCPPPDGSRVSAVVRYQGAEHGANFRSSGDVFILEFDHPVRAVAPGQAVVLYDGDEVLGGGTIARAT